MPPPPPPVRVLVVDDSFFMRTVLSKFLAERGDLEIVGQARTGREAVEKNLSLEPDVVTMDVEMPEMNGLEALEAIMKSRPVPVVMLSAHTAQGTETAMRALEIGAIECVGKPSGSVSVDIHKVIDELVSKIRIAAASRPGSLLPEPSTRDSARVQEPIPPSTLPARRIVAVASSTGGPRALNELLSRLTGELPAAFVIVQHMSIGFTQALARRLGKVAPFPVAEAQDGGTLMEGQAYVAPAGNHLLVTGQPGAFRFVFNDAPPRNGVKPAADLTLSSVAQVAGRASIGIVLTGMGKDGARGLADMRQAGAGTYAQDEASCVVYGMPRAAVELGAAAKQMSIPEIADALMMELRGSGT